MKKEVLYFRDMEDHPLHVLQAVLKDHFLVIGMLFLGLIFLLVGGFMLFPAVSKDSITFVEGNEEKDVTPISPIAIIVDVSGAVIKPGVYQLTTDARIQDAVQAAGGLTPDADVTQISKAINLAQKLSDGAKIYVPFQGEEITSGNHEGVQGTATTSLININTASLADLDRLPRIGAVTAQKIISNRPYHSLNDLIEKKVVSTTVFNEIQKLISL